MKQLSHPDGPASSEQILWRLTAGRKELARDRRGLEGAIRVLIGFRLLIMHREHKKSADFIRRRKVPWRFFVQEIALPHIDPLGSRHLAVSNGRLPDPVSRITPDVSGNLSQLRPFVKCGALASR